MVRNATSIDMVNGKLMKNMIMYSLPLMASGFLQLLFNAADLVVVGKYCGSTYMGAVGACGPIYMLIVNLFMGFSAGVTVIVSTGLGENNWQKVNRTVHSCIPLGLLCGGAVALIGCLLSRPMLEFMGTPDLIINEATMYLRIAFCGMPGNLVYNYCAAVLKANGDTKNPLKTLVIAGILNVGLNIIFVSSFNMNVAGVALATAISNILSAVLTIRCLTKLTNCAKLQFKYLKLHKETCKKILKIGVPAGVQGAMFSLSNIIIQRNVNSFGTAAISGSSAAQSINGFQYVLLQGITQATVNFVGQNYGAQKYDRIKKIRKISISLEIILGLISAGFIMLFSDQLLGIYIKDSAEAIVFGREKMLYVCVFSFINGMYDTYANCLRGIGQSLIPAVLSLVTICGVRLALIYTIFQIPKYHTFAMVHITYPASWIAAALATGIAFAIMSKKQFENHDNEMKEFVKDTFKGN